MLKFKLSEKKENMLVYKYYPEGRDQFGIISFDTKSNKINYIKIAENDEYKLYAGHLCCRLREFAKTGDFSKMGTVAWC